MDILAKEKKDESLIREVRTRESVLVNQRFNNLVQNNIEKKMFMTEMDMWAHSGFNTTRSSKSRQAINKNPLMLDLATKISAANRESKRGKTITTSWQRMKFYIT